VSVVDINCGLQGIVFNGMRGKAAAPFAKAPGKGRWAGRARHLFLYGGLVGTTLVKLTMSQPVLRFSST
jgi:hypothetical protein